MKILIATTIFLILPFFNLEAAQQRNVTSLNMDECWVGGIQESSTLKLAHFGAGESWQLNPRDFNTYLQELLDEMALHGLSDSKSSLETLVHCSSHGASLVFNIRTPQGRVCAWASFQEDSLDWQRFGVEPMAHHGHCTGAIPGDLILTGVSGVKAGDIRAELEALGLWDEQTDLRAVARGVYAVSLSKKFWFKEEKIIERLGKETGRTSKIKAAELNYYPHSVGEFFKLEELSGEL